MTKISIITPTYNSSKFIKRTILSVINQSFTNWEYLIIDDNSTDNTLDIINELIKDDPRFKIFKTKENSGGPALPKNIGIENAKGEYIAFLDHDDEWLPEKLEKQLEKFRSSKYKNLGIVSCFVNITNSKNKIIHKYKKNYSGNVLDIILSHNFIFSCSSVLIKREVLEKTGNFDTDFKIADDWDMWLRIAKEGYQFDFSKEYLLKYFVHGENICYNNKRILKLKEYETYYKKHKDLLTQNKSSVIGYYYFLKKEYNTSRKYYVISILSKKLTKRDLVKSFVYIILTFIPKLENIIKKIWKKIEF